MTRIKICGNTHPDDVRLALELGVDLLGFIFTRSKRQVSIEEGRELVAQVPEGIERVGVFVDEPAGEIARVVERCALTAIQVYRPVTSEDRAIGVRLLPAVRVKPGEDLRGLRFHTDDHPVLDTWMPDAIGGTGHSWNWPDAVAISSRYEVLVSGGLRPDNVGQAVRQANPWGVDVCSGVEAEPGRKDPAKVRAFVEAVREAEHMP
ncbi:MAG TPA: phosphoribosylanthranilate isomerase [Candidatus Dormibacteraeota bacterium]|jgi:phosphoribosylanthranilate isomerase